MCYQVRLINDKSTSVQGSVKTLKHSNEKSVKSILRYLIVTTRNHSANKEAIQGIVFKPGNTRSIDDYVDVSFSGEWNTECSDEPTSVISRTS